MHFKRQVAAAWTIVVLALWIGGCEHHVPPEEGPPNVEVSLPIEKTVTEYVDYTGRLGATDTMEVRARVTGYLWKMPFKEGDFVKKGDVLFEIDPRPYQADLDRALGTVKVAEAQLKLAKADYARAKETAKTPGAISQQEVDTFAAKVDVSAAQLDSAKANAEYARLNLEFCKVTSLIDGRVSRYLKTAGNLINQDNTLLTTVVTLDPIYAYFNVDELTMQTIQKLIREGKLKTYSKGRLKVLLSLQIDGDNFPYEGFVDFVNNQVDPSTGTIQVRAEFQNPKVNDLYLFVPNEFVRIRMLISDPHPALLVSERAIGTDQGQKFVYVVDEQDVTRYRQVTLGQPHEGLLEVTKGITSMDRIMVAGLQRVRDGMKVNPKLVPMPRPNPVTGDDSPLQPSPAPGKPMDKDAKPSAESKS